MAKKRKETENIYEIDHNIIAKHFKMTSETFRMRKKAWKEGKKSIWVIYCKAYQRDKLWEQIGKDIFKEKL